MLLQVSERGNPDDIVWGIMNNIKENSRNVEEALLWLARNQTTLSTVIPRYVANHHDSLSDEFVEKLLSRVLGK